ncbi:Uncharacterised protein [Neisseria canis]|uniref:Uncharacterized protein n=1 Tax=Neisseria canis TaxID=493 RepID=A0A3S4PHY7_9NEIS|nr:Uncharacterised protein [Neisseria canis]
MADNPNLIGLTILTVCLIRLLNKGIERINDQCLSENGNAGFCEANGFQTGIVRFGLNRRYDNLPWHCLYFKPLPQGQGSLRWTITPRAANASGL